MTRHLAPDELIAALEHTPEGPASAHLTTCATCRDALESLRVSWHAVAETEVPEPSPLFWEHFEARVRQATANVPAVESRWSTRWLVWATGAAAAVVLAVGLVWRVVPGVAVPVPSGAPVAPAVEASVEFDEVASVIAGMPADEVDEFAPSGTATWAMVDELTDDERAAFVRLVELRMETLP